MSIKKRKKLSFKAKEKRRKRRARLRAAGKNPDDYFYSGVYFKEKKSS